MTCLTPELTEQETAHIGELIAEGQEGWKAIGKFHVGTAQVLVGDPIMIQHGEKLYDDAGGIHVGKHHVTVPTQLGDGWYSVYAKMDEDNKPVALMISL